MNERRRREEQLRRAEDAAAEIFYQQGKQAKDKKESPDAVMEGTLHGFFNFKCDLGMAFMAIGIC